MIQIQAKAYKNILHSKILKNIKGRKKTVNYLALKSIFIIIIKRKFLEKKVFF